MSPVHHEMMDFISNDDIKKKMLLVMRGAGKSEIARAYITWYALNHPNERILVCSDTDSKAQSFVRAIKHTLESGNVKNVYGGVRGKVWTDHTLFFNTRTEIYPEGNITACGCESGAVTGKHFDMILIDDIVSFSSTRSELQRSRVREWLLTSLLPTLMAKGNITCVSTRYHQADIYATMIDRLNYDVLIIPPIRDGKATCFLRPIEDEIDERGIIQRQGLNSIKRELGSVIYSLQYNNDVSLLAEKNIIHASWINYYTELPQEIDDVIISVDLAIGLKDENDYTCIGVWGRDSDNNIYLMTYVNERFTFNQTINSILKLVDIYSPQRVLVEDIAFQKSTIQELVRLCSTTVIEGVTPITDKRSRLIYVSNLFENRQIFFNHKHQLIVDQIVYFPQEFDDGADMTSQALAYYKENNGSEGIVIW
jgi:predicted phage terminase large subunit-like protein